MRVINVIEVVGNLVVSVESFGVFEEQLSEDVVDEAEKMFKVKAIENGADENDLDDCLEEGNYENGVDYSISIVWSEIE
jgi:preprotein translocase subunit Sec63